MGHDGQEIGGTRGLRWRVSILAGLAIAGCGGGTGPETTDADASAPPDITLVLIDTLRRDHLDLYGYGRQTAPFLNELAQRSVVFERAHSTSSWTAPATATVLTGLYPPRHGIVLGHNAYGKKAGAEFEGVSLRTLPGSSATLPELLREAGYQTFGIASNINIDPARGFSRGFDRFQRLPDDTLAEDMAATLEEWADERDPGRPAFWYVHINDVHKPYIKHDTWYECPEGFDEPEARYDSEIGYVDQVLEGLSGPLAWDDGVLVVLADHGEEFGDHGALGHRSRLYAELVNVPLVVNAPGVLAGHRCDTPVSLIDVLPTIMDLAGVELSQESHGRSLVPLLGADGSLAERTLYAHRRKPLQERAVWAAVSGRWKLIVNDQKTTTELFDALADPTEQDNLAERYPDEVARLRERLDGFRELVPLEAETIKVEMDEGQAADLEGMGYGGGDDDDDDE